MLITTAHNLLPLPISDHLQYANTEEETLGDWSCEVISGDCRWERPGKKALVGWCCKKVGQM